MVAQQSRIRIFIHLFNISNLFILFRVVLKCKSILGRLEAKLEHAHIQYTH